MAGGDETKYQLSQNRFISVSDFKGKKRVDIREYYLNDDGERKPGKKGISLSIDEWKKLRDQMKDIDKAVGLLDTESESESNESSTN